MIIDNLRADPDDALVSGLRYVGPRPGIAGKSFNAAVANCQNQLPVASLCHVVIAAA